MSSVFLAQFINTHLAQLSLGFTVMNIIKFYVTLSKWNVKMNSKMLKSHKFTTLFHFERTYVKVN